MTSRFLRTALKSAPPYVPGEQLETKIVKLNTNECPYPPSPRALDAIASASWSLNRYPRPDADRARAALARRLEVTEDEVFVANGSDETLRIAFQAFVDPGAAVAWSTPTYTLYAILAGFAEARIIDVPRRDDWSIDIDALAAARAALTIIASPNSPTGTVTPIEDFERFAATGGLLLIDEAYADFAGLTAAALVKRYDNVIVARTLSKSYSLAGLRVGFAVAHPDLIAAFRLLKDSYNVSMTADAGAAAAIDDVAYTKSLVDRVTATRERLVGALKAKGWKVSPSGANFVFAVPPRGDGERVYRSLKDAGVLVRWFGSDSRTAPGIRITVGTDAEIDRLLEEIERHG